MLWCVHSRILLPRGLCVRQRCHGRWRVQHFAQDVQRGLLLPRGRDDSNRRRDGWCLPYWSVQHRGWCDINDICVHALPRGDVRICDYAAYCDLLGQLRVWVLLPDRLRVRQRCHRCWHMHYLPEAVQRGVLLPRGRHVCNRRRDGWCLPNWSVQPRGWCNVNDICVHALPRGKIWICYHAVGSHLLGRLRRGILLPRRLSRFHRHGRKRRGVYV